MSRSTFFACWLTCNSPSHTKFEIGFVGSTECKHGPATSTPQQAADTPDVHLRTRVDSNNADRGVNGVTIFPAGQLRNGWTVFHIDSSPRLYACSSPVSVSPQWISLSSTLSGCIRFMESLDRDPSGPEGRTRMQLEFDLEEVNEWQEVSRSTSFFKTREETTDPSRLFCGSSAR